MRQQPLHVAQADRHTSGRHLVTWLDQMEKDCRAAVALARGNVPIHHQTDIIKPVRPLHFFMARLEWCSHALSDQPVIGRMLRLVAPQHVAGYSPHRKRRLRQPDPLAAGKAGNQLHCRNRRRSIPFPLEGRGAGTTDRRLQSDSLERDNRPLPAARRSPDGHDRLFFGLLHTEKRHFLTRFCFEYHFV